MSLPGKFKVMKLFAISAHDHLKLNQRTLQNHHIKEQVEIVNAFALHIQSLPSWNPFHRFYASCLTLGTIVYLFAINPFQIRLLCMTHTECCRCPVHKIYSPQFPEVLSISLWVLSSIFVSKMHVLLSTISFLSYCYTIKS